MMKEQAMGREQMKEGEGAEGVERERGGHRKSQDNSQKGGSRQSGRGSRSVGGVEGKREGSRKHLRPCSGEGADRGVDGKHGGWRLLGPWGGSKKRDLGLGLCLGLAKSRD